MLSIIPFVYSGNEKYYKSFLNIKLSPTYLVSFKKGYMGILLFSNNMVILYRNMRNVVLGVRGLLEETESRFVLIINHNKFNAIAIKDTHRKEFIVLPSWFGEHRPY